MTSRKNLDYFIKQIENKFRVSVLVEMTPFMFLSQHRDTRAIFYLLRK